ncbi:zinc finger domain-containing protein [Kutzneria albida]|uniref:DNA-binding phage zinc finger domain-containing protein n=1 Tax=Kutzneria albida DSM 43870 TaxID=1449976 RepID=W5WAT1_9PSEU|nr:hypothetical protein [Kutzneria albida]AHH98233.1 hypothetical protein KALB_4871 [Kutzneria albida DSM 43870]
MNANEAGRILLMAISLDPKMPQPDDAGFIRSAWAAALHDVPVEAGQQAVIAYYRSDRYTQTRETIAPGDIVQWWNARRRPNEQERAGGDRRALPAPPMDPQRVMAGVSLVRKSLAIAKGVDPDEAEGEAEAARLLRSVRCPHCQAEVNRPCVGIRGVPLSDGVVHDSRQQAVDGQAPAVRPRSEVAARSEIGRMGVRGAESA